MSETIVSEAVSPPADPVANAAAAPAAPDTPTSAAPAEVKAPDVAPGTIATAEAGVDEKPVAGDWPDDWREKLAGGDDKMMARLKRFQSPANVLKSWRELEQKVSSGDIKAKLPESATEEQKAAFRKENGIPESAKEYAFDLGGIVPPEADKAILDGFKEFAHARNLPPSEANEFVKFYYEAQERQQAQLISEDKAFRGEATEELRAEWGGEYRSNINAIKNFAQSNMPDGLFDRLMGARLGDGRLLGDDPNALRWLASLAAEHTPGAGLMPAGTANVGKGIDARIAEIEQIMRTDNRAYWQDEKVQNEYAQLLQARDRTKSRAA